MFSWLYTFGWEYNLLNIRGDFSYILSLQNHCVKFSHCTEFLKLKEDNVLFLIGSGPVLNPEYLSWL